MVSRGRATATSTEIARTVLIFVHVELERDRARCEKDPTGDSLNIMQVTGGLPRGHASFTRSNSSDTIPRSGGVLRRWGSPKGHGRRSCGRSRR